MIRSIAAASLALVFAVGCSLKSHIDYDPGVDFAKYQTFAQAPPPDVKPTALVGYSDITARRIQDEIASGLQARGYQKASRSKADMVVAFNVSGEPRAEIVGYGPGWYGNTYTQHYVQGHLVVNVYDAGTKQMVWHGWVDARIYEGEGTGKRIPEAVEAILKKFPAR